MADSHSHMHCKIHDSEHNSVKITHSILDKAIVTSWVGTEKGKPTRLAFQNNPTLPY